MHTSSLPASATSISPAAMEEKYGSEMSRSATPIIVALASRHRSGLKVRRVAELGDRLVHPVGEVLPTLREPSFTTRDAVVSDTPARSATSCSVTCCPSGVRPPPDLLIACAVGLTVRAAQAYSREALSQTSSGTTPPRTAEGWSMARKVIHVALNGVTGRMDTGSTSCGPCSQSVSRADTLDDRTSLYPEPVLVGRSEERLRAIAERHGLPRWTTSLDEVLGDPEIGVYFDAQVTSARESAVARAIAAAKHVYTEKPVAASAAAAFALAGAARAAASPTASSRTSFSCPA